MVEANYGKTNVTLIRTGIYQIYGMKPGSHVYLVKGTDKNVLIDTGIATDFPVLKKHLRQIGGESPGYRFGDTNPCTCRPCRSGYFLF